MTLEKNLTKTSLNHKPVGSQVLYRKSEPSKPKKILYSTNINGKTSKFLRGFVLDAFPPEGPRCVAYIKNSFT